MADYAFGSDNWPGLAKLVEECGEVLEIAGKIMGVGGGPEPLGWDGTALIEALEEELADLTAAIGFVVDHAGLEGGIRSREKRAQFLEWHLAGDPPPTKTVTRKTIDRPNGPTVHGMRHVLVDLYDSLPADHPDRWGVNRALEVLRHYMEESS